MGAPMAWAVLTLAAVGFAGRHMHAGVGLGLGCFHRSHGKSRCTTTAILVPVLGGAAPTDLCWWLCEYSSRGTPGPAAFPQLRWNCALCEPISQVRGDSIECTLWWTVLKEEVYSVAPPTTLVLPISHHSSEMDLDIQQQLCCRPCPQQDCDNHRAKRRPCSISSVGFCHHHTSHMFILPKITNSTHWGNMAAGICAKNSPRSQKR